MIYNVTTSETTYQRTQSTAGNARLRFYNEGAYTAEITVGVDTRKVDPGATWDVAVSDVQVKMVSLDGPTTIRTYRVTSEAVDESDINGEIGNTYTKAESDAKFADKEQTEDALESLAVSYSGTNGSSWTKLADYSVNSGPRAILKTFLMTIWSEGTTTITITRPTGSNANRSFISNIQLFGIDDSGLVNIPANITNIVGTTTQWTVTFDTQLFGEAHVSYVIGSCEVVQSLPKP